MLTDALELARTAAETGQTERLSWGVIEVQVTDLDRAAKFWNEKLGLRIRSQDAKTAAIGTTDTTLILLHAGASDPVAMPHLGMYHVAIGMADQAEFSRMFARLVMNKVHVGPVDHLGAKSLYIKDPDGIEIEFTLETPERFGRFGDVTRGIILYDVDGKPHSGREPLDVHMELGLAEGADLNAPVSDGTFLAHMHFKVDDLEKGVRWFEGIGFSRNLVLADFGLADMGAGAAHTHRLAMNIWAGKQLTPTPETMAGLLRYQLHVHDPEIMKTAQHLTPKGTGLTGRDLTGVEINLTPAY